MTDFTDLLAKAKAATPGPWFVAGVRCRMDRAEWHGINRYDETLKRDENIGCVGYDPRTNLGFADAQYIAAASPDVIIALLEEREGMRNALLGIADLGPGYADMHPNDLVIILANKAKAALGNET